MLNHHIKSKHEGFRHSCNQCQFETAREWKLKEHVKIRTGVYIMQNNMGVGGEGRLLMRKILNEGAEDKNIRKEKNA